MRAQLTAVVAAALFGALPGFASTTELCPATPESMGLSSSRLAHLDAAMQDYVDSRKAAGVVAYVARGGRVVHLRGYGMADSEAARTMRADTLFRMASMTKPMTSVAALMLIEDGQLALEEPISKYLPGFARMEVAVRDESDGSVHRVPALRPITIRDLMNQTSGIPYGLGPEFGASNPIWMEAGIAGGYYLERDQLMSDLVERMASLPLDAQPGERFVYGHNTDILGVIIEKISGQPLDVFFQERIFDPLRMRDSFFYVPPARAEHLAAVYAASADGIRRADGPEPINGQGHFVEGPRKLLSGGAGLVSTAADYGRFAQMLINGGELDGVRLLSPRGVALMTGNHVGDRFANDFAPRPGMGFGLGVAVTLDPAAAGMYGTPGSYGWSGAYYTSFWVDPEEDVVMMILTQLRPVFDTTLQARFRTLVYQSIIAPVPAAIPACATMH